MIKYVKTLSGLSETLPEYQSKFKHIIQGLNPADNCKKGKKYQFGSFTPLEFIFDPDFHSFSHYMKPSQPKA